MKFPGSRTIFITIGFIIFVLAVFVFAIFRRKPPVPIPAEPTTQVTQTANQVVEYPVEAPTIAEDKIIWVNDGALEVYDLALSKVTVSDFPPPEADFIVTDVFGLKNDPENILIQIEKLLDSSRQLAIFNLSQKVITTKFPDRLTAAAWQPDRKKLIGFATSKTGKPYFLSTSLNAKDQKVLAEVFDENAAPLTLDENRLFYSVGNVIKSIDLVTKETKVAAESAASVDVSPGNTMINYVGSDGLTVLDAKSQTTITLSAAVPVFTNWSSETLIYGEKVDSVISISKWSSTTQSSIQLTTILPTDDISSVDAAFEDAVSSELIYWSQGFLYRQSLSGR